jgi:hypothetical protein
VVPQPRRALAVLLLLAACAAPARAAFVRSVMDRVDTEPLFDSEYFLDLRSFAWPRAWEQAWAASTSGYRVNGASLDCCDLYTDQSLKFVRRLTKGLEFRFRFTELSDKDRQETHHWLELEQDLGAGVSAELFGETSFRKEDADIGAGLRWKRGLWEARARRNAVDFNFNQRGSTTERYDRKPYTDEFLLAAPAGNGRAWMAAEVDQPTRRRIPAQSKVFGYRRTRLFSGWEDSALRAEYSYENQRKSDDALHQERRVHGASLSLLLDRWEPGVAFFHRTAWTEVARYKRWEAQPWLRYRKELRPSLVGELSPFLSLGEQNARLLAEAKLDAAIEWHFSGRGSLGLVGTFDLDTPGKPWDGGNVRAQFFF